MNTQTHLEQTRMSNLRLEAEVAKLKLTVMEREAEVNLLRSTWKPPEDCGSRFERDMQTIRDRANEFTKHIQRGLRETPPAEDTGPAIEPPAEPPSDVEQLAQRLDRLEEWQNRHHNDPAPLELAGRVKELESENRRLSDLVNQLDTEVIAFRRTMSELENDAKTAANHRSATSDDILDIRRRADELKTSLGAPHSALPLNTQVFNMSERLYALENGGSGGNPAAADKGEYANFDRINEVEANLDLVVGRADRQQEIISRIERWMNACIDSDKPDEADTRAKMANM